MKKIILTGYMASGKTTIGKQLAMACGFPFIDLDEFIEQKTGKTVPEIFAQDGEIKFRRLEHESLKEIVNDIPDGFVLSLGGGTPCYADNHKFLQREDVISVYLKAGIAELLERIGGQGQQRPLIDTIKPQEMEEFIAKHLFDRSYFYHQAKHVISVDGKTPEAIVKEIRSIF
ncbi:MAG: shikimate kinase [Flavobacterium sp.]|nr:MAG: shikimate kinase [Flavobacterium sp.]